MADTRNAPSQSACSTIQTQTKTQLQVEETKRDGRVWKGINWYVENRNKVLAEVIKQDGWDTKYM